MALTKSELNQLHEMDKKLAILIEQADQQYKSHDKIKVDVSALKKTVYENGLNTRVKELHDYMTEEREEKRKREEEARKEKLELLKQDDKQEHEIKLLGIKMSAEVRGNIITGFVTGSLTLLGVVLSGR